MSEINLPPHIAESFKLPTTCQSDQLPACINPIISDRLPFALSPVEFAEAISEVHQNISVYEHSENRFKFDNWIYLKLHVADDDIEVAHTPSDLSIKPPTAGGVLLFKYWYFNPAFIQGDLVFQRGQINRFPPTAAHSEFAKDFIHAWILGRNAAWDNVPVPLWLQQVEIRISSDSRLLSRPVPALRYDRLLFSLFSETKTKWRFLSLYRILEHSYLYEVFKTLQTNFFSDPTDSLAVAMKAMESEVNQFCDLVSSSSLQLHFEEISDKFKQFKSNQNRFAAGLDRSIKKSGVLKGINDKWMNGVLVSYKIRNSIVHAGMFAPIYDSFEDSETFVVELLPILEAAVMSLLGIEQL